MMGKRYKVQYALRDGNVYDLASFDSLANAQAWAEYERTDFKTRRIDAPVFITDTENPEAGDVSDKEDES